MRVALYLRVSTSSQTVENQERELAAVAAVRGWQVVETYRDEGISGAKGRDRRPGFDRLWKDAARRKFDVVAAWSVDRLGRSLADVATLAEPHAAGAGASLAGKDTFADHLAFKFSEHARHLQQRLSARSRRVDGLRMKIKADAVSL